MPKAFFQYHTEGQVFSFLQDTAIAAALGNTGATVGTQRLPHKLKPNKIALRTGSTTPFTYRHYVIDAAVRDTRRMGDAITIGATTYTVVGFDDETNNAFSAF